MTKPTAEQVAAWAKEAEVTGVRTSPENEIGYRMFQELQRFASLAYAAGQAAEREACAAVVEDWDSDEADPRDVAAAIRARGHQ